MADRTIEEPTGARAGGAVRPRVAAWPVRDRARRMLPYAAALAAAVLVAAGQVAEDLNDTAPLQLLTPADAVRRWTVIAAVVYMLVVSRFVDGIVERSVTALTGVIEGEADTLERYRRSFDPPAARAHLLLLLASALVVVLLFPVLGTSLPIDDPVTGGTRFVPGVLPAAAVVLVAYTLVGWALLGLVAVTIRRARALGVLSRSKFHVDVFDTTALLPFGNIALATSLAPAGVIVIFLIGFGRPTALLGWSVLVLATLASILALVLPLRPIHQRMARAKQEALRSLNARVREVYELEGGAERAAGRGADLDDAEIARLNNRVALLVNLRRTVAEMTTWPFRDTLALARALLIASAPLIYTIGSELIKAFLIKPLVP